jgi:predicted DNA-binding WGR domain protein
MPLISRTDLHFEDAYSDKCYHVGVFDRGEDYIAPSIRYAVIASYGRRGRGGAASVRSEHGQLVLANLAAERLVETKTRKHYHREPNINGIHVFGARWGDPETVARSWGVGLDLGQAAQTATRPQTQPMYTAFANAVTMLRQNVRRDLVAIRTRDVFGKIMTEDEDDI